MSEGQSSRQRPGRGVLRSERVLPHPAPFVPVTTSRLPGRMAALPRSVCVSTQGRVRTFSTPQ